MKTTLFILLSSCLSLWGQTPNNDTNLAVDTSLRDEILRRAVRQFETNQEPPAPAATAATNKPVTNGATPAVAVAPVAAPVPAATTPAAGSAVPGATPANVTTTTVIPVVTPGPTVVTAPATPAVAAPTPVVAAPAAIPAPTGPTTRLPGQRPQLPGAMPAPVAPGMTPAVTPTPTTTTTAAAEPAKPVEEPTKELNFPQIDLPTFLSVYANIRERTILHGPLQPVTISLQTQKPLTKTELIHAMDSVLAMNNIVMVDQGSNFVQAVTPQDAQGSAQVFTTTKAEDIPEAFQFMSQIVQLKYVKPSEVMSVLAPFAKMPNSIYPIDSSSMLIIRDYAANVKRMMEVIKQVDVIVPTEFEQEIIPIKYAQVSDIASALSSLGAGAGTAIGSRGTTGTVGSRGGLSGMGGGYTSGTASLGGGMSQIGATGGIGGGASPFGARANVPPSLANRLQGIATQNRGGGAGEIQLFNGPTKIVADERSHSLLVLAGHQDMEMIKSIVKKLDVVLQQVLIEAIIMEVNLDDELTIGVSYLQTTPSQGSYLSGLGALNNGTMLNNASFVNSGTNFGALPGGFSYLAHFGNDFDATATAIATDSRINVLSRPRIQTSDGVPASLKVGNTVPYVTGTYFGGVNGQAASQYQQMFVGLDLEVKPQINSEGLVVMDISQDVEQLGPVTQIDGNPVPTTTQRTAVSTVSVRDRDTVILGGFISNSKSKSHSGIPLLKDIPMLGALFRSSTDSNQRVELIALIRPTVLPTPEAAALVASHERTPGLKTAISETRIDDSKRLKPADSTSNSNNK